MSSLNLNYYNNFKILKNAYAFINSFTKTDTQEDNQILEPLSTMIMLSIISFKNVGTKIAISDNKIYIHPPNVIQGAVRWTFGNNREEVHYLLKPIFRALNIYSLLIHEKEEVRIIFEYSVKGLRLLKDSYNNTSSVLCHAIDLYINLINSALKNNTSNSVEVDTFKELDSIKDKLQLSQKTRVNLDNFFKGLWDDQEIKLISTMLQLAETNITETKSYIGAIESILSTKEKIINETINNATKLIT